MSDRTPPHEPKQAVLDWPVVDTARDALGGMDTLDLPPEAAGGRRAGNPSATAGRVYALYVSRGWVAVATWHRGFVLAEVPRDADLLAGDELVLPDGAGPGPTEVVSRRTGEIIVANVRASGLSADRLPRLVPAESP